MLNVFLILGPFQDIIFLGCITKISNLQEVVLIRKTIQKIISVLSQGPQHTYYYIVVIIVAVKKMQERKMKNTSE